MLQQRGDVPPDSSWVEFLYDGDDVRLFFNKQQVPVVSLGERPSGDPVDPTYPYFGSDVSQFAGQTVDIRSEPRLPYPDTVSTHRIQFIDDIHFVAVPEPGTLGLLALGVGVICLRLRRSAAQGN